MIHRMLIYTCTSGEILQQQKTKTKNFPQTITTPVQTVPVYTSKLEAILNKMHFEV